MINKGQASKRQVEMAFSDTPEVAGASVKFGQCTHGKES